jgi:hypothetical protein
VRGTGYLRCGLRTGGMRVGVRVVSKCVNCSDGGYACECANALCKTQGERVAARREIIVRYGGLDCACSMGYHP